jgi:hypothetical protein
MKPLILYTRHIVISIVLGFNTVILIAQKNPSENKLKSDKVIAGEKESPHTLYAGIGIVKI